MSDWKEKIAERLKAERMAILKQAKGDDAFYEAYKSLQDVRFGLDLNKAIEEKRSCDKCINPTLDNKYCEWREVKIEADFYCKDFTPKESNHEQD